MTQLQRFGNHVCFRLISDRVVPIRSHQIQTIYHIGGVYNSNRLIHKRLEIFTWLSGYVTITDREAVQLHLASFIDVCHELVEEYNFKELIQCLHHKEKDYTNVIHSVMTFENKNTNLKRQSSSIGENTKTKKKKK